MIASMVLAGSRFRDDDVLELACPLPSTGFGEVAERLEDGYDLETKILALTIPEPERCFASSTIRPAG